MASDIFSSDTVDPVVNLLQGKTSERARKVITAFVIARTGWEVGKKLYDLYEEKSTYRVTVIGDDEIYPSVLEQLLDMIPPEQRRSVTAASTYSAEIRKVVKAVRGPKVKIRRYDPEDEDVIRDDKKRPPKIRRLLLGYDGSVAQKVVINGAKVKVTMERPGADAKDDDERMRAYLMKSEKITFTAVGSHARDAVLDWLGNIADLEVGQERSPRFYIATRWGSWETRLDLPDRSMETVILSAGQAEEIIADLTKFFEDEELYRALGMPWHRGYLLKGPPGTGKTSIAKALANHFGMDMYFMPLADMERDTDLIRMISTVTPRSMLLLEDIDTAHAAVSRDDEDKKATLSGLLNSLDGVATPHGLVTIMTSNHPKGLDEALVREGRVDRTFSISYLTDDQIGRLCRLFFGEDLKVSLPSVEGLKVSPNKIIELFKQNLHDPDAAMKAVRKLIRKKS